MPHIVGTVVAEMFMAAALMRPMLAGRRTECLAVIHLDANYRLLGSGVHLGRHADRLRLPTRWLLKDALKLDARRLLIAHNHPGGGCAPSRSDMIATRDLSALLTHADVELVDHLLFAEQDFTSFRLLGLM